jgi:hypothetical protein
MNTTVHAGEAVIPANMNPWNQPPQQGGGTFGSQPPNLQAMIMTMLQNKARGMGQVGSPGGQLGGPGGNMPQPGVTGPAPPFQQPFRNVPQPPFQPPFRNQPAPPFQQPIQQPGLMKPVQRQVPPYFGGALRGW